jgi:hypothetical protein
MKFLISNYSNPWFTEPHYINASLNLAGVKSEMYNQQHSLYDNFDRCKPDIYVTHISNISKDLVSYLKDNKKIKLLISVIGANPEIIKECTSFMTSNEITHSVFSQENIELEGVKILHIPAGADIFLATGNKEFKIDKLIFVNNVEEIKTYEGTYHITSINQSIADKVDFILPITALNAIFSNYNEIIFCNNWYIGSQISFNAIYSGTKVIFDTKDSKDLDKIDNIFKKQKLYTSVKTKHTCLNRVKSLLSQLSYNDLASKLESEIEKL